MYTGFELYFGQCHNISHLRLNGINQYVRHTSVLSSRQKCVWWEHAQFWPPRERRAAKQVDWHNCVSCWYLATCSVWRCRLFLRGKSEQERLHRYALESAWHPQKSSLRQAANDFLARSATGTADGDDQKDGEILLSTHVIMMLS